MCELFTAFDPGEGDVRKSLSSADNMENCSCTWIIYNVDQQKSIGPDGIGSYERPQEFPRCIFLLQSLGLVCDYVRKRQIKEWTSLLWNVSLQLWKIKEESLISESSWASSVTSVHLQNSTEGWECCSADYLKRGMLHCEQLREPPGGCFLKLLNRFYLAMSYSYFYKAHDSPESHSSVKMQESCTHNTTNVQYAVFFPPSGERCWHSTNRNIQTDTAAVFLCKLYSGVCMFSPSSLTGVSCSRWLPEWGGWWGRRGKVRPTLDLNKEVCLLGSTRNCKPKYTIGVKCSERVQQKRKSWLAMDGR